MGRVRPARNVVSTPPPQLYQARFELSLFFGDFRRQYLCNFSMQSPQFVNGHGFEAARLQLLAPKIVIESEYAFQDDMDSPSIHNPQDLGFHT